MRSKLDRIRIISGVVVYIFIVNTVSPAFAQHNTLPAPSTSSAQGTELAELDNKYKALNKAVEHISNSSLGNNKHAFGLIQNNLGTWANRTQGINKETENYLFQLIDNSLKEEALSKKLLLETFDVALRQLFYQWLSFEHRFGKEVPEQFSSVQKKYFDQALAPSSEVHSSLLESFEAFQKNKKAIVPFKTLDDWEKQARSTNQILRWINEGVCKPLHKDYVLVQGLLKESKDKSFVGPAVNPTTPSTPKVSSPEPQTLSQEERKALVDYLRVLENQQPLEQSPGVVNPLPASPKSKTVIQQPTAYSGKKPFNDQAMAVLYPNGFDPNLLTPGGYEGVMRNRLKEIKQQTQTDSMVLRTLLAYAPVGLLLSVDTPLSLRVGRFNEQSCVQRGSTFRYIPEEGEQLTQLFYQSIAKMQKSYKESFEKLIAEIKTVPQNDQSFAQARLKEFIQYQPDAIHYTLLKNPDHNYAFLTAGLIQKIVRKEMVHQGIKPFADTIVLIASLVSGVGLFVAGAYWLTDGAQSLMDALRAEDLVTTALSSYQVDPLVGQEALQNAQEMRFGSMVQLAIAGVALGVGRYMVVNRQKQMRLRKSKQQYQDAMGGSTPERFAQLEKQVGAGTKPTPNNPPITVRELAEAASANAATSGGRAVKGPAQSTHPLSPAPQSPKGTFDPHRPNKQPHQPLVEPKRPIHPQRHQKEVTPKPTRQPSTRNEANVVERPTNNTAITNEVAVMEPKAQGFTLDEMLEIAQIKPLSPQATPHQAISPIPLQTQLPITVPPLSAMIYPRSIVENNISNQIGHDTENSDHDPFRVGDKVDSSKIKEHFEKQIEEQRRLLEKAWHHVDNQQNTIDSTIISLIIALAQGGNSQAQEWLSKYYKDSSGMSWRTKVGFPTTKEEMQARQWMYDMQKTRSAIDVWLTDTKQPIPSNQFWSFYQYANLESYIQTPLRAQLGLSKTKNHFSRITKDGLAIFTEHFANSFQIKITDKNRNEIQGFLLQQQWIVDLQRWTQWWEKEDYKNIADYFDLSLSENGHLLLFLPVVIKMSQNSEESVFHQWLITQNEKLYSILKNKTYIDFPGTKGFVYNKVWDHIQKVHIMKTENANIPFLNAQQTAKQIKAMTKAKSDKKLDFWIRSELKKNGFTDQKIQTIVDELFETFAHPQIQSPDSYVDVYPKLGMYLGFASPTEFLSSLYEFGPTPKQAWETITGQKLDYLDRDYSQDEIKPKGTYKNRYVELKNFPIEPGAFIEWTSKLQYKKTKSGNKIVDNPFLTAEVPKISQQALQDFQQAIESKDPYAIANQLHMEEHMLHVKENRKHILSLGINYEYYYLLVLLHDAGKFIPSQRVLEFSKGNDLLGRIVWHDQSTVDYLLALGEKLNIDPDNIEHLIADIIGHNDGSRLPGIFWNNQFPNYPLPNRLEGDILAIFDRYGQGNWIGARKILPQTVQKGFYEKVENAFYTNPKDTLRQLKVIYERATLRLRDRTNHPDAQSSLDAIYQFAVQAQMQTIQGYQNLKWSKDRKSVSITTADGIVLTAKSIVEFLEPAFQQAFEQSVSQSPNVGSNLRAIIDFSYFNHSSAHQPTDWTSEMAKLKLQKAMQVVNGEKPFEIEDIPFIQALLFYGNDLDPSGKLMRRASNFLSEYYEDEISSYYQYLINEKIIQSVDALAEDNFSKTLDQMFYNASFISKEVANRYFSRPENSHFRTVERNLTNLSQKQKTEFMGIAFIMHLENIKDLILINDPDQKRFVKKAAKERIADRLKALIRWLRNQGVDPTRASEFIRSLAERDVLGLSQDSSPKDLEPNTNEQDNVEGVFHSLTFNIDADTQQAIDYIVYGLMSVGHPSARFIVKSPTAPSFLDFKMEPTTFYTTEEARESVLDFAKNYKTFKVDDFPAYFYHAMKSQDQFPEAKNIRNLLGLGLNNKGEIVFPQSAPIFRQDVLDFVKNQFGYVDWDEIQKFLALIHKIHQQASSGMSPDEFSWLQKYGFEFINLEIKQPIGDHENGQEISEVSNANSSMFPTTLLPEEANVIQACIDYRRHNANRPIQNGPVFAKTRNDYEDNLLFSGRISANDIEKSSFFQSLGLTDEERWKRFSSADYEEEIFIHSFLSTQEPILSHRTILETNPTHQVIEDPIVPTETEKLISEATDRYWLSYQRTVRGNYIDQLRRTPKDKDPKDEKSKSITPGMAYDQLKAVLKEGKVQEANMVLYYLHDKNKTILNGRKYEDLNGEEQIKIDKNVDKFKFYLIEAHNLNEGIAHALAKLLSDTGVLGLDDAVITFDNTLNFETKEMIGYIWRAFKELRYPISKMYTYSMGFQSLPPIDPGNRFAVLDMNLINERIASDFAKSNFKDIENVKFDPQHFQIYLHYANKSEVFEFEDARTLREILGLKRNDLGKLIFRYSERTFDRNFQFYLFKKYPSVNWFEVQKVLRLLQNIQDILFINKHLAEENKYHDDIENYFLIDELTQEQNALLKSGPVTFENYLDYFSQIGKAYFWHGSADIVLSQCQFYGLDCENLFNMNNGQQQEDEKPSALPVKPKEIPTIDEYSSKWVNVIDFLSSPGKPTNEMIHLLNEFIELDLEKPMKFHDESVKLAKDYLYYTSQMHRYEGLSYNSYANEGKADRLDTIVETLSLYDPSQPEAYWFHLLEPIFSSHTVVPQWSLEDGDNKPLVLQGWPKKTLFKDIALKSQLHIYFLKNKKDSKLYFYLEPAGQRNHPGKVYPIELLPHISSLFTSVGLIGGIFPQNPKYDFVILEYNSKTKSIRVNNKNRLENEVTIYEPDSEEKYLNKGNHFIEFVLKEHFNEQDLIHILILADYMNSHPQSTLNLYDSLILIFATHMRGERTNEANPANHAKNKAIYNLIEIGVSHGLDRSHFEQRVMFLARRGILGNYSSLEGNAGHVPRSANLYHDSERDTQAKSIDRHNSSKVDRPSPLRMDPNQSPTFNEIIEAQMLTNKTKVINEARILLEMDPTLLTHQEVEVLSIAEVLLRETEPDYADRIKKWKKDNEAIFSNMTQIASITNPLGQIDLNNLHSTLLNQRPLPYSLKIQNAGHPLNTDEAALFEKVLQSQLRASDIKNASRTETGSSKSTVSVTLQDGTVVYIKGVPGESAIDSYKALYREYGLYSLNKPLLNNYPPSLLLHIEGNPYFVTQRALSNIDYITSNNQLHTNLIPRELQTVVVKSGDIHKVSDPNIKKRMIARGMIDYDIPREIILFDLLFGNYDRKSTTNISMVMPELEKPLTIQDLPFKIKKMANARFQIFDGDNAFSFNLQKQDEYPAWMKENLLQLFTYNDLEFNSIDELIFYALQNSEPFIEQLKIMDEAYFKERFINYKADDLQIYLANRSYLLKMAKEWQKYSYMQNQPYLAYLNGIIELQGDNGFINLPLLTSPIDSYNIEALKSISQRANLYFKTELKKFENDAGLSLRDQYLQAFGKLNSSAINQSLVEAILILAHEAGNTPDGTVSEVKKASIGRAMHLLGQIYPDVPSRVWKDFFNELSKKGNEILGKKDGFFKKGFKILQNSPTSNEHALFVQLVHENVNHSVISALPERIDANLQPFKIFKLGDQTQILIRYAKNEQTKRSKEVISHYSSYLLDQLTIEKYPGPALWIEIDGVEYFILKLNYQPYLMNYQAENGQILKEQTIDQLQPVIEKEGQTNLDPKTNEKIINKGIINFDLPFDIVFLDLWLGNNQRKIKDTLFGKNTDLSTHHIHQFPYFINPDHKSIYIQSGLGLFSTTLQKLIDNPNALRLFLNNYSYGEPFVEDPKQLIINQLKSNSRYYNFLTEVNDELLQLYYKDLMTPNQITELIKNRDYLLDLMTNPYHLSDIEVNKLVPDELLRTLFPRFLKPSEEESKASDPFAEMKSQYSQMRGHSQSEREKAVLVLQGKIEVNYEILKEIIKISNDPNDEYQQEAKKYLQIFRQKEKVDYDLELKKNPEAQNIIHTIKEVKVRTTIEWIQYFNKNIVGESGEGFLIQLLLQLRELGYSDYAIQQVSQSVPIRGPETYKAIYEAIGETMDLSSYEDLMGYSHLFSNERSFWEEVTLIDPIDVVGNDIVNIYACNGDVKRYQEEFDVDLAKQQISQLLRFPTISDLESYSIHYYIIGKKRDWITPKAIAPYLQKIIHNPQIEKIRSEPLLQKYLNSYTDFLMDQWQIYKSKKFINPSTRDDNTLIAQLDYLYNIPIPRLDDQFKTLLQSNFTQISLPVEENLLTYKDATKIIQSQSRLGTYFLSQLLEGDLPRNINDCLSNPRCREQPMIKAFLDNLVLSSNGGNNLQHYQRAYFSGDALVFDPHTLAIILDKKHGQEVQIASFNQRYQMDSFIPVEKDLLSFYSEKPSKVILIVDSPHIIDIEVKEQQFQSYLYLQEELIANHVLEIEGTYFVFVKTPIQLKKDKELKDLFPTIMELDQDQIKGYIDDLQKTKIDYEKTIQAIVNYYRSKNVKVNVGELKQVLLYLSYETREGHLKGLTNYFLFRYKDFPNQALDLHKIVYSSDPYVRKNPTSQKQIQSESTNTDGKSKLKDLSYQISKEEQFIIANLEYDQINLEKVLNSKVLGNTDQVKLYRTKSGKEYVFSDKNPKVDYAGYLFARDLLQSPFHQPSVLIEVENAQYFVYPFGSKITIDLEIPSNDPKSNSTKFLNAEYTKAFETAIEHLESNAGSEAIQAIAKHGIFEFDTPPLLLMWHFVFSNNAFIKAKDILLLGDHFLKPVTLHQGTIGLEKLIEEMDVEMFSLGFTNPLEVSNHELAWSDEINEWIKNIHEDDNNKESIKALVDISSEKLTALFAPYLTKNQLSVLLSNIDNLVAYYQDSIEAKNTATENNSSAESLDYFVNVLFPANEHYQVIKEKLERLYAQKKIPFPTNRFYSILQKMYYYPDQDHGRAFKRFIQDTLGMEPENLQEWVQPLPSISTPTKTVGQSPTVFSLDWNQFRLLHQDLVENLNSQNPLIFDNYWKALKVLDSKAQIRWFTFLNDLNATTNKHTSTFNETKANVYWAIKNCGLIADDEQRRKYLMQIIQSDAGNIYSPINYEQYLNGKKHYNLMPFHRDGENALRRIYDQTQQLILSEEAKVYLYQDEKAKRIYGFYHYMPQAPSVDHGFSLSIKLEFDSFDMKIDFTGRIVVPARDHYGNQYLFEMYDVGLNTDEANKFINTLSLKKQTKIREIFDETKENFIMFSMGMGEFDTLDEFYLKLFILTYLRDETILLPIMHKHDEGTPLKRDNQFLTTSLVPYSAKNALDDYIYYLIIRGNDKPSPQQVDQAMKLSSQYAKELDEILDLTISNTQNKNNHAWMIDNMLEMFNLLGVPSHFPEIYHVMVYFFKENLKTLSIEELVPLYENTQQLFDEYSMDPNSEYHEEALLTIFLSVVHGHVSRSPFVKSQEDLYDLIDNLIQGNRLLTETPAEMREYLALNGFFEELTPIKDKERKALFENIWNQRETFEETSDIHNIYLEMKNGQTKLTFEHESSKNPGFIKYEVLSHLGIRKISNQKWLLPVKSAFDSTSEVIFYVLDLTSVHYPKMWDVYETSAQLLDLDAEKSWILRYYLELLVEGGGLEKDLIRNINMHLKNDPTLLEKTWDMNFYKAIHPKDEITKEQFNALHFVQLIQNALSNPHFTQTRRLYLTHMEGLESLDTSDKKGLAMTQLISPFTPARYKTHLSQGFVNLNHLYRDYTSFKQATAMPKKIIVLDTHQSINLSVNFEVDGYMVLPTEIEIYLVENLKWLDGQIITVYYARDIK